VTNTHAKRFVEHVVRSWIDNTGFAEWWDRLDYDERQTLLNDAAASIVEHES